MLFSPRFHLVNVVKVEIVSNCCAHVDDEWVAELHQQLLMTPHHTILLSVVWCHLGWTLIQETMVLWPQIVPPTFKHKSSFILCLGSKSSTKVLNFKSSLVYIQISCNNYWCPSLHLSHSPPVLNQVSSIVTISLSCWGVKISAELVNGPIGYKQIFYCHNITWHGILVHVFYNFHSRISKISNINYSISNSRFWCLFTIEAD